MMDLCKLRIAGLLALTSASSGCYSFQGVPQIINAGGVVNQQGDPDRSENLKDNFAHAVRGAAEDDQRVNWANVNAMLETGFALTYANCDDFFMVMASGQRDSSIARDAVAPVVAILTGIISLKDFSDPNHQQDLIEGITLGSSTYLAALNIYDQHFLFGAENVYEVELLTLDALDASEKAIREMGTMNFESAVQQLIRHQGVCTPAGIKHLVKRAITTGDVVANPRLAAPSAASAAQLFAIGNLIGLPRAVTDEEAAALWWFYLGGAKQSDYPKIAELLAGTNVARGFQGTDYDATRADVDALKIVEALSALPPTTLASYQAARDKYIAQAQAKARDASAPAPAFEVPLVGGASGFRLDVR